MHGGEPRHRLLGIWPRDGGTDRAQLGAAGTRAKIRALLAQGRLLYTPGCPVATIEQASVWADCIKSLGDRFAYAFSWHYQNVDICKPFDLKTACKDGHCVSAQIERQARLLRRH